MELIHSTLPVNAVMQTYEVWWGNNTSLRICVFVFSCDSLSPQMKFILLRLVLSWCCFVLEDKCLLFVIQTKITQICSWKGFKYHERGFLLCSICKSNNSSYSPHLPHRVLTHFCLSRFWSPQIYWTHHTHAFVYTRTKGSFAHSRGDRVCSSLLRWNNTVVFRKKFESTRPWKSGAELKIP